MADTAFDRRSTQIDQFITMLKKDAQNADIDTDLAQTYADIFGRSLTSRIVGRVTVTFEVELDANPGTSADNIDGSDFDFELSPSYSADFACDTWHVDDVDFDLDEEEE